LTVPKDETKRIVCPKCGAKIRVRRKATADASPGDRGQSQKLAQGDGYIRFNCPCGRRLKVDAAFPPSHGQCPDCGRHVPVPKGPAGVAGAHALPAGHPVSMTDELDPNDRAALDQGSEAHLRRTGGGMAGPGFSAPPVVNPNDVSTVDYPVLPPFRAEAGLRVCPHCGKPVHLGAETCRACGTPVPRRKKEC
jgi:hypothetical protein